MTPEQAGHLIYAVEFSSGMLAILVLLVTVFLGVFLKTFWPFD